ncbi:ribosomal oxygenase 1 [Pectinophora gossypiella]|uniref:ribosomal oxygenase 1 n=1 Tax=Pectinophora gossypiella TaxID=13191 RepID=UPI00214E607D|nr:ribosomal oxygenase 1 [Pectinophora gossypiella]
MDSPLVSAFAIYKTNKENSNKNQGKGNKKQKNRNTPKKSKQNVNLDSLSEDLVRLGAKKLKQKQMKAKEAKNIGKRKSHKKKKEKEVRSGKKNQVKSKNTESKPKMRKTSENEEVPTLIPAIYNEAHNPSEQSDSVCSHSEDGYIDFTPVQTDSREEALKVFKWMIAPYDTKEFFDRIWEKKPLHIARNKPNYYMEVISTPIIDDMLRNENIMFTKNVDITSYVDNERKTHNPEGKAYPHLVWDFYLNGCSIRLLNPQTYIPKLHLMNATMQEFFNSFVGANAYLTPPDSQGFAPHYDDIEAFILQAEGKKHWRIYKPRTKDEVLPRFSSKNFDQEEIGEPILEVTLEAGDMLYFPRGYIHQGVTIDGEHSLHVTISMYQKHSWADLFEKLIYGGLQKAIAEDVEFRKGLPFDLFDNFGCVHESETNPRRKEIENKIMALFSKMKNYLPIDDAVDQVTKSFQHAALPPVLSDLEKAVTVHGDSDVMIENGKVINRVEIGLDTRIRLLRKNIVRLVAEESLALYYYAENSLEYHGNELSFIEVQEEMAPAIEGLIKAYPEYVEVESLNLPNDSDKLNLADALWSRGLIMTEYPLETLEDD